jgi:hypothetical protein
MTNEPSRKHASCETYPRRQVVREFEQRARLARDVLHDGDGAFAHERDGALDGNGRRGMRRSGRRGEALGE